MSDDAVAPPRTPAALRHRCLRELVHALNGRASVVRGLAELAALAPQAGGEAGTLDLAKLLAGEADALEEIARHLQLVVPPATDTLELLDPVELLDEALQLLGCMGETGRLVSGHRGDAAAEGVPPLRASASELRGAILVALDRAERTRLERGNGRGSAAAGRVLLREAETGGLSLEVRPLDGGLPVCVDVSLPTATGPTPGPGGEPPV